MRLMCVLGVRLALLLTVVLLPGFAFAQSATTGSIAGIVKDTTGAILPGVTVEAASPALIEKVRSVVTDERGNYKIVDLRPGTYSVTFTLPGFATFKREGIELTSGFTATANADMKVGALEETVTVTGASPVVDIQNVRSQALLSQQTLETLPTGGKNVFAMAALTLGASAGRPDVGGDRGEQASHISIHGSRSDDGKVMADGMPFNSNHTTGGGMQRVMYFNTVGTQEVVLDTGANSAEAELGGVNLNLVPKDGGNNFSLYQANAYTNSDLSSKAIPQEVRDRGIGPQPTVKQIWDYGVGVGGPIKRDRIWFYSPQRWWGSQQYAASGGNAGFFDAVPGDLFYQPDFSRPAYVDSYYHDHGARITWQVTGKHRITFSENMQWGCSCWLGASGNSAPDAVTSFVYGPQSLTQGTWNYPMTSRILIQAGASYAHQFVSFANILRDPSNPGTAISDTGLGISYGGLAGRESNGIKNKSFNLNERASVAYVTGSHSFKAGMMMFQGLHESKGDVDNALSYTFVNRVPNQLTQWASPYHSEMQLRSLGMFAQDQWTINRLTLNLGLRFDHYWAYTKAEELPAGRFVGPRSFPSVRDYPNLWDVNPRLGAAYDLFGTGKTAIKVNVGRYVSGLGAGLVSTVHPANAIVISTTRTWTDTNGNYQPDCNLTARGRDGECGPMNNILFGTSVQNLTFADDVRLGWGNRENNWQTAVSLQHELRQGFGVNVGYFRTQFFNHVITDNSLVQPQDYDEFCVTAPTDPRLGENSGQRLCGLYDIKPEKFGLVNSVRTLEENFGKRREVFNGVDVGANYRFGRSGLVQGGVSFGRTSNNSCALTTTSIVSATNADAPPRRGFCGENLTPWLTGMQIKMAAAYPLPWDSTISTNIQNLGGNERSANVTYTGAQIAAALGRTPSAGATATRSIAVMAPNREYEPRFTQIDLRFSKGVRIGKARIQGIFEIYNVTNTRAITGLNSTYGTTASPSAAWLRPTTLMGSRLFKFGSQFDW